MNAALTALFMFFIFVAVLFYAVMILRWVLAWTLSNDRELMNSPGNEIPVSVIIAVRNEHRNIVALLRCLFQQNYNPSLLEIIISDDFSEDGTVEVIEGFLKERQGNQIPVKVIKAAPGDVSGKKAALKRGIEVACGTLILTTDADCTMGSQWVKSFVKVFQETGASLISGFVKITDDIAPWQALEFLSLSGTGVASLLTGKPLMCNGANLAFIKEAFQKVGGYDYGEQFPGGDDTFLMLSMRKNFGEDSVSRNPFRESVVTTLPAKTISEFIHQRVRWAAKVNVYRENYIRVTGALMYLTNFFLLIMLIGSLSGWITIAFTLVIWLIKGIADGLLLWKAARFAGQEYLLYLILPATILYPIYLTAAGIIMLTRPRYQWKGRDH